MAKKKRSEKHIHVHNAPVVLQPRKAVSPSLKTLKFPVFALMLIILITILAYMPVFKAGFVWDDIYYVQRNLQIRSINIRDIFSGYVMGNYHPFTMLVFAIEYQLFGLNETGYHIINLLLHLMNLMLVFYAVFLLSNRINVALIAAFLFGIHPLHVESVAWVSELKDLLYTFFFLGAYIFYLRYLNDPQKKFYLIALLLFLCSLLSKAMAASLPVLLLLTDYFKSRKINLKTWLEKAPFFFLALIFGIVAVFAQKSSESIQDISIYSFPQRIVFACYGFITCLWKLIIPVQLSAFYPYPIKNDAALPAGFYIYPFLLIGLVTYAIYSLRFSKKIMFGLGFFAITVFLVLQLLPVGDAVMADRYSYVPSIGIFYLVGEGFYWLWNKRIKFPAVLLLIAFAAFFSVSTFMRAGVWETGIKLWTDVISKYPNTALGYNNRGGTYLNEKNYELALRDLNKAIELRPGYAEALNNRAIIFSDKKKYQESLNDLNKAIVLRADYPDALNNRGIILMELNRYPEALIDFNKAIELRPAYAEAYYNRGLVSMREKKYEQALADYNKALELKPGYTEAIINRRLILGEGNDPDEALTDYTKAMESNPDDPQLYYKRGILMMSLNKKTEAINDFNRAIELKPDYAEAYYSRGTVYSNEKKTEDALKDYDKAIELNPELAEAYVNRANISRDENRHEKALKDYNKAIELKPSLANSYYNRGILLIKEKRFEEGIEDFSKAIELKGDSAMSYYNKGMAEFFLGKTNNACNDLQRATTMGIKAAENAYNKFCK